MSKKSKRTKDLLGLPWSASDYASIYSASLDDNVAYVGLDHEHGDAIRTPRDRAIRDHIVRACNQHDKLVGMVKKMDEELRDALDCQCYHGFICSNCAILNEAREFITEAGKT